MNPRMARSIMKPTDVTQKTFLKSAFDFRPFGSGAIRTILASARSDNSGYSNDLAKHEYSASFFTMLWGRSEVIRPVMASCWKRS